MIIVDTETTGLYPEKNSIVSIGALDFCNPENWFYIECGVWNGAEFDEYSLKINGFTKEQIKNCPISLETAIDNFLGWVKKIQIESDYDITLAGENPWFDINFLKNSAERYKLEWFFSHRAIDLHSISVNKHLDKNLKIPLNKNKYSNLKLDETLKFVGIPEEPMPHNALTGAKVEAEAFSRIIYGEPLLEKFGIYKVPDYLRK